VCGVVSRGGGEGVVGSGRGGAVEHTVGEAAALFWEGLVTFEGAVEHATGGL